MKILIIGLLSAALITVAPTPAHINNSVGRAEAQTVQATANEITTDNLQEPSPQPPKPTVSEISAPVIPQPKPSGKYALMQAAGIPEKDWAATDYIISHESSWRHTAWGKKTRLGHAYGLCQALPSYKMASEGEDYMTNPVTQLRWCHKYAHKRYGGWAVASAYWRNNRWW